VRRELEALGIVLGEARGSRTPTTVVMPVDGERSMVTVDPGLRARASDLDAHAPSALAATLEQIDLLPAGPKAFVTCGDDDARAFAGRLPTAAARPRALIVNRREATLLTGERAPAAAAAKLATVAETAVVTLGPDGAVASVDGRALAVDGVLAEPVLDTTGAGDLFATAFAWADLHGAAPDVALRWANLYAGLSVMAHTGTGGALPRERLVAEGTERGLPELPASASAP
jgi:ribokinase